MKTGTGRNNKGIALILTVGVLALMVLIGTSFAVNMMLDYKSSVNTLLSAQAKAAAEAGLNIAIVSARNTALTNFTAVPASPMNGSLGNVGRGNTAAYSVTITDTASQINVNDTNPNLDDMLEDLVAILGSPLQAGDGSAVVSYRATLGGQLYLTKEQVIDAFPGATLAVKKAKFNKIATYITVNSYIDENSEDSTASSLTGLNNPPSTYQRKAPVNVNTAAPQVLRAVLAPLITPTDPTVLTNDIVTRRNTNFFDGWNDFNGFIDDLAYLTGTEKIKIKNNANPNKIKVGSGGLPFSYTTDFCFHPSGIYEITSTGTVGAAQKTITAFVRIYNVVNYTTKEQFRGEDTNYNDSLDPGEDKNGNGIIDGSDFKNVNWLNSCPVVSSYDPGLTVNPPAYSGANANAIANSLKLGFWDNFDEDNDNVNKVGWSWSNWEDSEAGDITITDVNPVDPSRSNQPDLRDGDNELSDTGYRGSTALAHIDLRGSQPDQWNCGQEFSLRVYCNVLKYPPSQVYDPTYSNFYNGNDRWEGYEDTEQIDFVSAGNTGKLFINNFRCVYYGSYGYQESIDGVPGMEPPPHDFIDSMLRLTFPGGGGDHYIHLNGLYSGMPSLSPQGTFKPSDANRIVPINATFRLIVHGSAANNYQVYTAVSPTGIAYHEWYAEDGGAWVPWYWQIHYLTYNAFDTNYHQLVDVGETNRYDYGRHDAGNQFIYTDWYLRLINHPSTTMGRYALFDEVRLIPDQGYYICPTFTTGGNMRFGTASWTLTIPQGAVTNERAEAEVDSGSGFNAVNINGGANIDPSMTLRLKVTLKSDDPQHLQTPIIEDITFTYLPKAEVLYQRQK